MEKRMTNHEATERLPLEESEACAEERRKLAAALGLSEEAARKLKISDTYGYGPQDYDDDLATLKALGRIPVDFGT